MRSLTVLLVLAWGTLADAADVVSIWGGARGTIVLKSDGTVWTWGANFAGKLGVGLDAVSLVRTNVPIEVHGPGNVSYLNSITNIMGGEVHSIAVKSDGTVWGWGQNEFGQLGDGTTNDESAPVQVGLGCVPPLGSVTKLGGRTYWNLAVKTDGTVWAWGMNQGGQLGNGTTISTLDPNQNTTPVQLTNSRAGGVINNPIQVSCGYTYGVALATNGTVWTWGTGSHGELGNGTTNALTVANPVSAPILVDKFGAGFSNIVMTAARDYHNLAVKADGSVWMWGANDQGQCGDGTTNDDWQPTPVVGLGARVGRILNWQPGGDNLTLKWDTATGEYFAIEYTTNLAAGFTSVIQSNLLSTPPANTVTLTNGPGYYRLKF